MCNAAKAEWQARPLQRDSQTREAATRRRRWKPRRPRVTIKQEQLQRKGGAGSQGRQKGQSNKRSCNAKAAREAKAAQGDQRTREAATREAREARALHRDNQTRAAATRRWRGKSRQPKATIKQEKLHCEGGAGTWGIPKKQSIKSSCIAKARR